MVKYKFEIRNRTLVDKFFRREGNFDSYWTSEDEKGLPRIGDKFPIIYDGKAEYTYKVFEVIRASQTREDVPYDTTERIGKVPDSLDRVLVELCRKPKSIRKPIPIVY